MALKALVTIDDATVAVGQIVLTKVGSGWEATFYGTVNKSDGTPIQLSLPGNAVLTAGQNTTVNSFATTAGIPALKSSNNI